MSGHMVETKDSGGNLWFTIDRCHNCDRRTICNRTLFKYAEIINEDEKIKEAKTIGDVVIGVARSLPVGPEFTIPRG